MCKDWAKAKKPNKNNPINKLDGRLPVMPNRKFGFNAPIKCDFYFSLQPSAHALWLRIGELIRSDATDADQFLPNSVWLPCVCKTKTGDWVCIGRI